jgi:hypothetical protein
LFAATQWIGDCAVSHLAAGRLLRLESIPRPTLIDTSCARRTGKSGRGVAVHHTRLPRADLVTVDRIACTSATRTIIDLAARLDAERLEAAFESSVKELVRVLDDRPLEPRLEIRVARLLRVGGIHIALQRAVA